MTEQYEYLNDVLTIIDSEMGISIQEPFSPIRISLKKQKFPKGYALKRINSDEGVLQEIYLENHGVTDGQQLSFYPTGKIKMEIFYASGIIHGPSTFFDSDGYVTSKSWYIRGLLQGKSWWYYPSGALFSLQRFHNGVWHGKQEYYFASGKPKTEAFYLHGKLDGVVKLYRPNGQLTTLQYSRGEKIEA
jgi:antitoxin component YwqK of YwqJK toxin-antitoxin module